MYKVSICYGMMRVGETLEKVLNCYFKTKKLLVEIRKYSRLSDMMKCDYRADMVFLDAETVLKEGFGFIKFLSTCKPKRHLCMIGDSPYPAKDDIDLVSFSYFERPVDLDMFYNSLDGIIESQEEVSFTSNYLNVTLNSDEIVCIYSFARRTFVVTDQGQVHPTINSMRYWQDKVSDFKDFYHPHYSYIINSKYINSFDGRTIVMKCINGKAVTVMPSQKRMSEFRSRYNKMIASGK